MVFILFALLTLLCLIITGYYSLRKGLKLPLASMYLQLGYAVILISAFVLSIKFMDSFRWIQDLFLALIPGVILAVIALKFAELKLFLNERISIKHAYLPTGVVLVKLILFLYLTVQQHGSLFHVLQQIWEYLYIIIFFLLIPSLLIIYSIRMLKTFFETERDESSNLVLIDLFGFFGCFIGFIAKQFTSNDTWSTLYLVFIGAYFLFSTFLVIKRLNLKSNPLVERVQSDVLDRIHEGFRHLFDVDKIYLDSTLSLRLLTKKLQSNEKYVSSYINNTYHMSFNAYVNRYRIEEAKRLLLEVENMHFTIETIAQMAGFHNKSTFNLAFKKETGLTPSQYKAKNLS